MAELTQILLKIDFTTWLLDVAVCAVFYHIKRSQKQLSSSYITTAVVMVLGGIMTAYTPYLHYLYEQDKSIGDQLIFAWHAGFACFDLIAIIVIWFFHWKNDLQYGEIARYMTRFYCVLGLIQVARWIDRQYLGTNVLDQFYNVSIATIGYVTTGATIMIAVQAVRSEASIKIGRLELEWKI